MIGKPPPKSMSGITALPNTTTASMLSAVFRQMRHDAKTMVNSDKIGEKMDYDPNLGDNLSALKSLVHMGYIEANSPAEGIAKLFLHEGLDSLSSKQRFIFDKEVAPVLFKTCERCDEGIEISTLPDAYEQGLMLCSYHLYKHHKDE